MSEAPAVELRGVTARYAGQPHPAVEDVSLTVPRGGRIGVYGPNGGGKSTLVRMIAGLHPPSSGSISTLGVTPAEARRAGRIGLVSQRPTAELRLPTSPRVCVRLASEWKAADRKAARARADELIDLVGASSYAGQPMGTLSGGQLQRVLVARALARRPELLLLDEPFVGIDHAGQAALGELLNTVHESLGLTLVLVSHDLAAITAGCDSIACLARTMHLHAAPDGLTPDLLYEIFQHDVATRPQGDQACTHEHGADA